MHAVEVMVNQSIYSTFIVKKKKKKKEKMKGQILSSLSKIQNSSCLSSFVIKILKLQSITSKGFC